MQLRGENGSILAWRIVTSVVRRTQKNLFKKIFAPNFLPTNQLKKKVLVDKVVWGNCVLLIKRIVMTSSYIFLNIITLNNDKQIWAYTLWFVLPITEKQHEELSMYYIWALLCHKIKLIDTLQDSTHKKKLLNL